MCGRFLLDLDFQELYRQFLLQDQALTEDFRRDVSPTDSTPVIIQSDGCNRLDLMRWGLEGYPSKQLLINARRETLMEKRRFSPLMVRQRCIIPATGFYEWEHQGSAKFRREFRSIGIIPFAGLFESSSRGNRFVIVTMAASGDISAIHDRMPVSFAHTDVPLWLDEKTSPWDAYRCLERQRPDYTQTPHEVQLSFF